MSATARAVVAGLLVPVVVLLALVGVIGTWVRGELLDTDRYVAAVGPLAADPAVQEQVAAAITTAARNNLGTAVPAPARPAVDLLVGQTVIAFTRSPTFAALWTDLNRAGHEQIARLLRGDDRPVPGVVVRGGTVALDLGPAATTVLQDVEVQLKAQLRAIGVDLALQVPERTLTVDIAATASIERARPWVARLDGVTPLVPWLFLGCTVAAVLAARHRLRLLVVLAVAVTLGTALLLGAVRIGSALAATSLATLGIPDGLTAVLLGRLTVGLRTDALVVAGAATVVALAAALARALTTERHPRPARRPPSEFSRVTRSE